MTRQSYTDEQRVEAVALALTVGPVRAGRQLGIPAKTVSNWQRSPEAQALRLAHRDFIIERFRGIQALAFDQVEAGLKDRDARLSDKVRALEVASSQIALLSGDVTERTETTTHTDEPPLSTAEVADLIDFINQVRSATSDEELNDMAARQWPRLGSGNGHDEP